METTSLSSSSSSPIHEDIGSSVVSQIGLNLELGRGSESEYNNNNNNNNNNNKVLKSFCGFTFLQIQELKLQALIFKYISSGLSVPNHLLLPIWQSFSSSLARYPTSLGIRPIYLDSRKGIDEEPWRCRRTDGKKWRCSKEALQNHKYCERHIHRGRHRSRKLVDSSSRLGGAINTTTNANIIGKYSSNLTELSISTPQNVSSSSILFPM